MNQQSLVTAAFITIGLHSPLNCLADFDQITEIYAEGAGHGQTDLVYDAVQHSDFMDRLLYAGAEVYGYYPGVAMYEVAEPFGNWFAAHILQNLGHPPGERTCEKVIRSMVTDYFTGTGRAEGHNLPAIVAALDAVPFKLEA